MNPPCSVDVEQIEIRLLLEGVYRHSGYDFREYAPASLRRRIWHAIREENLTTIPAFQEKLLRDAGCLERFLLALSVNVTAMFRDPGFYLAFRSRVLPYLRTYPFIRIWHAGCSTGEEVYSSAILMHEAQLYDRCKIYATDMSDAVLRTAESGAFPLEAMRDYTTNYIQAGGDRAFSDYYSAQGEQAVFRPWLRKNLVFAVHNLVTDSSFNEFNIIFCRNVMIYFSRPLQERVHNLLHGSLGMLGFLALGPMETLRFSAHEPCYEIVSSKDQIYRKVR